MKRMKLLRQKELTDRLQEPIDKLKQGAVNYLHFEFRIVTVTEYPTMQYFGICRNSQSMRA